MELKLVSAVEITGLIDTVLIVPFMELKQLSRRANNHNL